MKIGIITYALRTGGVETYIETLSKFFLSSGHSVDIVETLANGERSDELKSRGFAVHTILIGYFESQNHYAYRLVNFLNNFDVLILNHVPFVHNIFGLLKSNIVILPILHNNLSVFYDAVLHNCNQINKIICVSPALKHELGIKKYKLTCHASVIVNGVSTTKSYDKKFSSSKQNKLLNLIYVGRIEKEQKGVLLLPKIISNILQESSNFTLKIIGDGSSLDILKRLIRAENVEHKIELLGRKSHSQTLSAIFAADILIMPSYYEGLGLVYLEAMGQGTVPVVSRLKYNTDIYIQNGLNGFLCEIGNTDSFSSAIITLIKDKNKLEQMSLKAWETAHANFSITAMGEKYLRIITEEKQNINIVRTKKLDHIALGNLPFILIQTIRIFSKIKTKLLMKFKEIR